MGELSIKIKIADREYPMKVDANDEERVRSAGRLLNEKMKAYRDQFGIDDKQDLLAMVAFDSTVEKMLMEQENNTIEQEIFNKLSSLHHTIDNSI